MSLCVRSYREASCRCVGTFIITDLVVFLPPPRSFLGIEGRALWGRVAEKRFSGQSLSVSIRFRFPRFNSPFK